MLPRDSPMERLPDELREQDVKKAEFLLLDALLLPCLCVRMLEWQGG